METTCFTFRKAERMVSQKLIDQLFSGGHSQSLSAFPLRVVFTTVERTASDEPIQVLMSVPKKRLRHAVDRNRVKRQLREAYRLHRSLLSQTVPGNRQLLVAWVWLSDRLCPSQQVESRMVQLLKRIGQRL